MLLVKITRKKVNKKRQRKLARKDFIYFCKHCLGKPILSPGMELINWDNLKQGIPKSKKKKRTTKAKPLSGYKVSMIIYDELTDM